MKPTTMRWMLIFLSFTSSAFGQLVWEQKELAFQKNFQEGNVKAAFKFQNVGDRPIRIVEVTTSCSCTTGKALKQVYEPGEKGEVVVDFLFGGRRGMQDKTIKVQTDDPKEPVTILNMKVDIIELLKMRPGYVYWTRGEGKHTQTMTLTVNQSVAAKVKSVVSSKPNIVAELKTIEEGKEYEIILTPLDTDTPVMSTLTIQTDYPRENPEVFRAYAQVK